MLQVRSLRNHYYDLLHYYHENCHYYFVNKNTLYILWLYCDSGNWHWMEIRVNSENHLWLTNKNVQFAKRGLPKMLEISYAQHAQNLRM